MSFIKQFFVRWLGEPMRGFKEDHAYGVEALCKFLLVSLRVLSLQYAFVALFPRGDTWRRRRDIAVDASVIGQFLLIVFLWWLYPGRRLSVCVSAYTLFCLYLSLLNIFFFSKNRTMGDASTSPSRSLILIGVNFVQVVFSFAIFYERLFSLQPRTALFGSSLVTGTIGLPANATEAASAVVSLHVLLNIVLLSIVIASVAGKMQIEFRDKKSGASSADLEAR